MKTAALSSFIADVEECADDLVTETGEPVAAAWYESLKQTIRQIQATPEIGRLRRNLPLPDIRTLNLRKHPKYLVFYRLHNGKIELLRARHGMMSLPKLFSE